MKKTVCVFLVIAITIGALVACAPSEEGQMPLHSIRAASDGEGILRILLLGCDRTAALTDSILLVTVDTCQDRASILQIPRDTYAEYTDRSYKKINGAVNALGVDGFQNFLEEVLGVEIDAYVSLAPDALVSIVDAIGGVDLTVPQDMDYSDPSQGLEIHLKAGEAHLGGREAEQFVRYRSGYANADLGRLDAQKLFLRAFAKRCRTLSFSKTVNVIMRMMTTVQTNIALPAAIRLIGTLRACDENQVPIETLPGLAVRGESGAWYYVVNRDGAVRAINSCLQPQRLVTAERFDGAGRLDRESNKRFHTVYEANESQLPLLADSINHKQFGDAP